MTILIEADRLRKCFGPIVAVDEISLQVVKGEVLGFLGPNGAGKSTTMKMLTGFLEPDSGIARIAGIDVAEDPKAAKAKLGYLPEGAPSYPDMTPRSFLSFIAEIRGFIGRGGKSQSRCRRRQDRAARRVEPAHRDAVEGLQAPRRPRAGDPARPGGAGDGRADRRPRPQSAALVRDLIRQMAKDKAIIISTHILARSTRCARAPW